MGLIKCQKNQTIPAANHDGTGQSGVLISRFVLVVPDSVQFHRSIIFCLESDSIAVSCIHGVLLFLSTTYEREMSTRI